MAYRETTSNCGINSNYFEGIYKKNVSFYSLQNNILMAKSYLKKLISLDRFNLIQIWSRGLSFEKWLMDGTPDFGGSSQMLAWLLQTAQKMKDFSFLVSFCSTPHTGKSKHPPFHFPPWQTFYRLSTPSPLSLINTKILGSHNTSSK